MIDCFWPHTASSGDEHWRRVSQIAKEISMRKALKSIRLSRETLLQLEQPLLKKSVGGISSPSHCDTVCGATCLTICIHGC
jgi:hypothetical protein